MKKIIIAAMAIALVFALTGCPDPEQLKNQTATLTNLFGENHTATIKGTFTNTQWNGVAGKIEGALNGAYQNATGPQQSDLLDAFHANNIVIIVEKTTAYSTYKTVTGNKTTLYVNIDGLDNLQSKIGEAAIALYAGNASTANAIPPAHDKEATA